MARKTRSRNNSRAGRGVRYTANRPRLPLLSPLVSPLKPSIQIEDRRRYFPAPFIRPAVASPRSAARLIAAAPATRPLQRSVVPKVRFAIPPRVMVCVRRKQRKEVIHAKGIAGRKGLRPPRRNQFSDVSC